MISNTLTEAMYVNDAPPKEDEEASQDKDVEEISRCGELEVIEDDTSPSTSLMNILTILSTIYCCQSHTKKSNQCAENKKIKANRKKMSWLVSWRRKWL